MIVEESENADILAVAEAVEARVEAEHAAEEAEEAQEAAEEAQAAAEQAQETAETAVEIAAQAAAAESAHDHAEYVSRSELRSEIDAYIGELQELAEAETPGAESEEEVPVEEDVRPPSVEKVESKKKSFRERWDRI